MPTLVFGLSLEILSRVCKKASAEIITNTTRQVARVRQLGLKPLLFQNVAQTRLPYLWLARNEGMHPSSDLVVPI